MLARDVRALAEDPATPAGLQQLARGLVERYAYPVDTQILSSGGKLLAQLPVELLFSPEGMDYPGTLREALAAVK